MPLQADSFSSLQPLWSVVGFGASRRCSGWGMLLDLTGCRGRSLAAHAGGVNCFRGDQIQVLVIRDLIEPVPVLQELNVQVLVDLLQKPKKDDVSRTSGQTLELGMTCLC